MTSENNKAIVKDLIEANTLASIDELCAPDFIGHLPGFPAPTDRKTFVDFASMLYSAFPDLHHIVEVQLAEDDMVSSVVKVTGTHQGTFQGIPATGKKIVFYDLIVARFKDGKAVELWAQLDVLNLLQQLGVNPF
ncbi:MAG: SnoaL-like polyketide cyclase [Pelotomaculum sp. PtaB.Bin104]|nr:MAG: SnoaL-like polyketide cyclase [Pelotomaculum sp. PtaB.Bin104]